MKILISTFPFGKTGRKPLDLLEASGHELIFNPYGRRLKAGEVNELLKGVDAVIAGTEPYNRESLSNADRLRVISRVGIGLDNVDCAFCRMRQIMVTYTPDAPSDGVAELTLANILNLLRHVHESDRSVREKAWNRLMGRLVHEVTIGILGVGRIGSRVIHLLESFGARVIAFDTDPHVRQQSLPGTTWVSVDELFSNSDIITIHIPLSTQNRHFIDRQRLAQMKTGSMLVNTARGSIVDENALTDALMQGHLSGAALDVFEAEPYLGPMTRLSNVILTAHIAASARETRFKMELGAAEDCLRVLTGEPPQSTAPME